MRPYRIIAIGEVLWDMLPSGKKVGGAPGNFAYHCRKLGADADMISRVGDDELGRELLEFYQSVGLSTDYIVVDPDHPTGAVDVELDANGQPRYVFRDNVAWDHLQADADTLALLRTADAICYGTLAGRCPESLRAMQAMIAAPPIYRNQLKDTDNVTRESVFPKGKRTCSPEISIDDGKTALRVFDVNFRAPHYTKETVLALLPSADILKLNDEELPILGQMLGQTETDPVVLARWMIDRYGFKLFMLTRGERGSLLLTPDAMSDYRSRPVQVVDTVGAGDAFTAAAVIGFLAGQPLEEINRTASDLAARVCTYPGAMTPY